MTARRTAVGIDLGTTDVFAANVGRKGVEIVQNSVSERRTPALVGFTNRRRLLGDAAYAQVKSNYKNSCRGLKHIVGRAWDSPEIEAERFWSLCVLGKGEQGDAGYQVAYCGEDKCVSATVCLSMLVTSIVATCKAWTKMDVNEVVLAIPSYYTERVRQACLDALRIAGVNCLRLLHESTAIALAWRFERQREDDSPLLVAFCSAGHSGLLVAVARFHRGAVHILGEAYDLAASGRNMDRMLMDRFAESLVKQGAPDPLASAKARLKLEEAATKVKKTLSVVDEARGTAECVVEDYDLSCDVKRDWFEEKCIPLVEAMKATVARALAVAGVEAKDLSTVEMVGGCSRIPFVRRTLQEAFGRELSTTLNADEAVARGCAWQAAMLSPLIRLDQIPLKESGTPAVALEWKDSEAVVAEGSEAVENGQRRLTVFEAHAGPNIEAEVAFRCKGPLELRAIHVGEDGKEGEELGCWSLPFPKEMEDVELLVSVNYDGLFGLTKAAVCKGKEEAAAAAAAEAVEAAERKAAAEKEAAERIAAALQAAEEEEAAAAKAKEEEAAAGEDASKTEATEGAEASPPGGGSKEEVAEGATGEPSPPADQAAEPTTAAEEAAAAASPEGAAATEGGADTNQDQADQEKVTPEFGGEKKEGGFNWKFWQWRRGSKDKNVAATAETKQKRKVGGGRKDVSVKREAVKFVAVRVPGFTQDVLTKAGKAERKYREVDAAVVEAENRRNDYETHIFKLRDKLSAGDELIKTWASSDEQKALASDLEEAEAWVYENIDEVAAVYSDRLKALTKIEKECASRKANLEATEEKVKALRSCIKRYKSTAISSIYEYIAKEKRDKITEECDQHTEWLKDLEKKQATLNKWDTPVISGSEVTQRSSTLTKNATKILAEPRPEPPKPEKDEKEKDGKKNKKNKDKKGDQEEKEPEGDNKTAADAAGADQEKKKEDAEAPEAPKRPKWHWYLGGGVLTLLLVLTGGLVAGYGQPYGVPSPVEWLSGGYFDSEGEALMHEVDSEEPAIEDSPADGASGGSEQEL